MNVASTVVGGRLSLRGASSRLFLAAFPASIAFAVTLGVVSVGWISDDGYITARYADNLLHGYGPVFNPGEHVQGFSHPLWLGLMTVGQALSGEPLLAAVVLGALFTFAFVTVAWHALIQTGTRPVVAAALLACLALVLSVSEAWRSFQTSGLENSLSHLLIALLVLEIGRSNGLRPERVSLLAGLLTLTRPDLAVLAGPLALYALYVAFRRRTLPVAILAYAPLLAWLLFAQIYYGTMIPNTATSKLGLYGFLEGADAGLTYALDWIIYEAQSAVVLAAFVGLVIFGPLRAAERWLALGVALYAVSLVIGGGDFMRGRMLLPIFVALLLLGAMAAARLACRPGSLAWLKPAALGLALLFAAAQVFAPPQAGFAAIRSLGPQLDGLDISNERLYYSGHSMAHYAAGGTPLQFNKDWASDIQPLRAFSEQCGSFAILNGRLGAMGYALGPAVVIVDIYGLTDATISHLPRSQLLESSRRGHPQRMIPVSYLAARHDITLFSNWREAVHAGDCGIIAATQAYASSNALLAPFDQAARPVYAP